MRKAILVCICILASGSAAGFAQAPSEAPFNLAAILNQPTLSPVISSACATPGSQVLFAAKKPDPPGPGQQSACNATASCGDDGSVSCSGNSTCITVDRSCPGEQGHVTCDGVTTWCPVCEPCSGAFCCACQNTGACFACCRCDGGTAVQCANECS